MHPYTTTPYVNYLKEVLFCLYCLEGVGIDFRVEFAETLFCETVEYITQERRKDEQNEEYLLAVMGQFNSEILPSFNISCCTHSASLARVALEERWDIEILEKTVSPLLLLTPHEWDDCIREVGRLVLSKDSAKMYFWYLLRCSETLGHNSFGICSPGLDIWFKHFTNQLTA